MTINGGRHDIQDRDDIDRLMRRFYSRVLADEIIGYIFTDVAKLDLEHHLPLIGDFWESIVFQNPVYAQHGRNRLEVHGRLNAKEVSCPNILTGGWRSSIGRPTNCFSASGQRL